MSVSELIKEGEKQAPEIKNFTHAKAVGFLSGIFSPNRDDF
jgi:hypothetical protein